MSIEQHSYINCAQESTLAAITKTLDRMERGQEKVVDLLEKVANQEAKIGHLQEGSERTFKSVNELFGRVRALEVSTATSVPEMKEHIHATLDTVNEKLDKLNRFFELTTSRPAIIMYSAIATMIAVGAIIDIMYHLETIKALVQFVRG